MPFPMKIQPVNNDFPANRDSARVESGKPVLKSRLKRLLDRPFTNVLRSSNSDKSLIIAEEAQYGVGTEFEPSSVALAKMVQNYMEENNEKQARNGMEEEQIGMEEEQIGIGIGMQIGIGMVVSLWDGGFSVRCRFEEELARKIRTAPARDQIGAGDADRIVDFI